MTVAYIDENRERVVEGRRLGVEPIIETLCKAGIEIAPSTYYATKTRPLSARAVRDAELVTDIKVVHQGQPGCLRRPQDPRGVEPRGDQRRPLHRGAADAHRRTARDPP